MAVFESPLFEFIETSKTGQQPQVAGPLIFCGVYWSSQDFVDTFTRTSK
jgi:hypothetical protein